MAQAVLSGGYLAEGPLMGAGGNFYHGGAQGMALLPSVVRMLWSTQVCFAKKHQR